VTLDELRDVVTDGALLDVDELVVLAGRTVTRAYRTGDPEARDVDAAHGRIWSRTRGRREPLQDWRGWRGVIAADDVDVMTIVDADARLCAANREHSREEHERRAEVRMEMLAEVERERQERAAVDALGLAPSPEELAAVLARRPVWPTVGALRGKGRDK